MQNFGGILSTGRIFRPHGVGFGQGSFSPQTFNAAFTPPSFGALSFSNSSIQQPQTFGALSSGIFAGFQSFGR